jgi:hypothetical protein
VCADLDTLLIAVYCAACSLFPAEPTPRRGRPQLITDNELVCLMVAQMFLQCPSDRVFLRRAHRRLGRLFPYLPSQPRYNERCRRLVPKLVLLWKALAAETLGADDDLRLLDTTPLPCGQSIETTRRSELAPWAGFGYCPAHSRRYWGFKLVLLCAPDGTICDFDLVAANSSERQAALALLEANPDRRGEDHLRQGLRRRRLRSRRTRAARPAPAAQPQRRAQPAPTADRLDPSTDRVDRQHTQRPTPARTARRPHPRRATRTRHRPHPRALRRHQPQPTPRTHQPHARALRRLTDQPSRRVPYSVPKT